MATAQAFVRSIAQLPDPRRIPLEDVVDTLVRLITEAGEVDFGPQLDRHFVADVPGQGVVLGRNPQIVDGKLVLEIHKPGQSVGPPLGVAEEARRPSRRDG